MTKRRRRGVKGTRHPAWVARARHLREHESLNFVQIVERLSAEVGQRIGHTTIRKWCDGIEPKRAVARPPDTSLGRTAATGDIIAPPTIMDALPGHLARLLDQLPESELDLMERMR